VGLAPAPEWLDVDGLHGYVLGRAAQSGGDHRRAAARYAELVAAGLQVRLWDSALRQQIYLGDEAFVDRMQALADPRRSAAREVPKAQRRRARSLAQWLAQCASREEALYLAYTEGGLSMTAIAADIGLSVSRVSRLIAQVERAKGKT
jgi:DNA-directed RNA polymerase specialized sigma24 family protein